MYLDVIPISKYSEQWKQKSYFSPTFFNKNISKTDKSVKSSGFIPCVGFQGRVSVLFCFMLCRNKYCEKIPKAPRFFTKTLNQPLNQSFETQFSAGGFWELPKKIFKT